MSTEGHPLPLDIYSFRQKTRDSLNKWKRLTKWYSKPGRHETLEQKNKHQKSVFLKIFVTSKNLWMV